MNKVSLEAAATVMDFETVTAKVHEALQPACQYNYNKDILTAQAMEDTGEGNCFTHAEAACLRLLDAAAVATAGIYLTLGPKRTNYHAGCIAFGKKSEVALVDLMKPRPAYLDYRAHYEPVREICLQRELWLYGYAEVDQSGIQIQYVPANPETPFAWPEKSEKHTVYMPAAVGVLTLHAIARRRGMRQLELDAGGPANESPLLPTLPKN